MAEYRQANVMKSVLLVAIAALSAVAFAEDPQKVAPSAVAPFPWKSLKGEIQSRTLAQQVITVQMEFKDIVVDAQGKPRGNMTRTAGTGRCFTYSDKPGMVEFYDGTTLHLRVEFGVCNEIYKFKAKGAGRFEV